MRYSILSLFLIPSTLLAQDGTVEYSMEYQVNIPSVETTVSQFPPDLPVDSVMIQDAMQQFADTPDQFRTIPMHMEFSGHISLMKPSIPSLPTGTNPFGGKMPLALTYTDHLEGKLVSQMPNFGGKAPYLVSEDIESLDWNMVDVDSTILNYPVKKAESLSDSLKVVAWYTLEIPSMAGPMQFGGLPGLPLSVTGNFASAEGITGTMSFVAVKLEERLNTPIKPLEGVRVTQEEYLKIMSSMLDDS